MKITAIKQQLKQTDRYSIFVDDKYAFSLSETALLNNGVVSGTELSAGQLDEYKRLSADDKLYNRALRYAALRSRTVWEMKTYLIRKGAVPALIEQTIEKLRRLKLLDDAAYAINFVRDRQLLRPSSRRKLELELRKRHVPGEYINLALTDEDVDEHASLEQVIIKKRRQTKYRDDTKLLQYLVRQGFNYGDVRSALQVSLDDD